MRFKSLVQAQGYSDGPACVACGDGEESVGNEILLCDGKGCRKAYHLACLPEPLAAVPEGDWYCHHCEQRRRGRRSGEFGALASYGEARHEGGDPRDVHGLGTALYLCGAGAPPPEGYQLLAVRVAAAAAAAGGGDETDGATSLSFEEGTALSGLGGEPLGVHRFRRDVRHRGRLQRRCPSFFRRRDDGGGIAPAGARHGDGDRGAHGGDQLAERGRAQAADATRPRRAAVVRRGRVRRPLRAGERRPPRAPMHAVWAALAERVVGSVPHRPAARRRPAERGRRRRGGRVGRSGGRGRRRRRRTTRPSRRAARRGTRRQRAPLRPGGGYEEERQQSGRRARSKRRRRRRRRSRREAQRVGIQTEGAADGEGEDHTQGVACRDQGAARPSVQGEARPPPLRRTMATATATATATQRRRTRRDEAAAAGGGGGHVTGAAQAQS